MKRQLEKAKKILENTKEGSLQELMQKLNANADLGEALKLKEALQEHVDTLQGLYDYLSGKKSGGGEDDEVSTKIEKYIDENVDKKKPLSERILVNEDTKEYIQQFQDIEKMLKAADEKVKFLNTAAQTLSLRAKLDTSTLQEGDISGVIQDCEKIFDQKYISPVIQTVFDNAKNNLITKMKDDTSDSKSDEKQLFEKMNLYAKLSKTHEKYIPELKDIAKKRIGELRVELNNKIQAFTYEKLNEKDLCNKIMVYEAINVDMKSDDLNSKINNMKSALYNKIIAKDYSALYQELMKEAENEFRKNYENKTGSKYSGEITGKTLDEIIALANKKAIGVFQRDYNPYAKLYAEGSPERIAIENKISEIKIALMNDIKRQISSVEGLSQLKVLNSAIVDNKAVFNDPLLEMEARNKGVDLFQKILSDQNIDLKNFDASAATLENLSVAVNAYADFKEIAGVHHPVSQQFIESFFTNFAKQISNAPTLKDKIDIYVKFAYHPGLRGEDEIFKSILASEIKSQIKNLSESTNSDIKKIDNIVLLKAALLEYGFGDHEKQAKLFADFYRAAEKIGGEEVKVILDSTQFLLSVKEGMTVTELLPQVTKLMNAVTLRLAVLGPEEITQTHEGGEVSVISRDRGRAIREIYKNLIEAAKSEELKNQLNQSLEAEIEKIHISPEEVLKEFDSIDKSNMKPADKLQAISKLMGSVYEFSAEGRIDESVIKAYEKLNNGLIKEVSHALFEHSQTLLSNFDITEFTKPKASRAFGKVAATPTLSKYMGSADEIANSVSSSILSMGSIHAQVLGVKQWIEIAGQSLESGNAHAAMAIFASLASMGDLLQIIKKEGGYHGELYQNLSKILSAEKNYSQIRKVLDERVSNNKPVIPNMVYYGQDVTFIEDANENIEDQNKLKAKVEDQIKAFKSSLKTPAPANVEVSNLFSDIPKDSNAVFAAERSKFMKGGLPSGEEKLNTVLLERIDSQNATLAALQGMLGVQVAPPSQQAQPQQPQPTVAAPVSSKPVDQKIFFNMKKDDWNAYWKEFDEIKKQNPHSSDIDIHIEAAEKQGISILGGSEPAVIGEAVVKAEAAAKKQRGDDAKATEEEKQAAIKKYVQEAKEKAIEKFEGQVEMLLEERWKGKTPEEAKLINLTADEYKEVFQAGVIPTPNVWDSVWEKIGDKIDNIKTMINKAEIEGIFREAFIRSGLKKEQLDIYMENIEASQSYAMKNKDEKQAAAKTDAEKNDPNFGYKKAFVEYAKGMMNVKELTREVIKIPNRFDALTEMTIKTDDKEFRDIASVKVALKAVQDLLAEFTTNIKSKFPPNPSPEQMLDMMSQFLTLMEKNDGAKKMATLSALATNCSQAFPDPGEGKPGREKYLEFKQLFDISFQVIGQALTHFKSMTTSIKEKYDEIGGGEIAEKAEEEENAEKAKKITNAKKAEDLSDRFKQQVANYNAILKVNEDLQNFSTKSLSLGEKTDRLGVARSRAVSRNIVSKVVGPHEKRIVEINTLMHEMSGDLKQLHTAPDKLSSEQKTTLGSNINKLIDLYSVEISEMVKSETKEKRKDKHLSDRKKENIKLIVENIVLLIDSAQKLNGGAPYILKGMENLKADLLFLNEKSFNNKGFKDNKISLYADSLLKAIEQMEKIPKPAPAPDVEPTVQVQEPTRQRGKSLVDIIARKRTTKPSQEALQQSKDAAKAASNAVRSAEAQRGEIYKLYKSEIDKIKNLDDAVKLHVRILEEYSQRYKSLIEAENDIKYDKKPTQFPGEFEKIAKKMTPEEKAKADAIAKDRAAMKNQFQELHNELRKIPMIKSALENKTIKNPPLIEDGEGGNKMAIVNNIKKGGNKWLINPPKGKENEAEILRTRYLYLMLERNKDMDSVYFGANPSNDLGPTISSTLSVEFGFATAEQKSISPAVELQHQIAKIEDRLSDLSDMNQEQTKQFLQETNATFDELEDTNVITPEENFVCNAIVQDAVTMNYSDDDEIRTFIDELNKDTPLTQKLQNTFQDIVDGIASIGEKKPEIADILGDTNQLEYSEEAILDNETFNPEGEFDWTKEAFEELDQTQSLEGEEEFTTSLEENLEFPPREEKADETDLMRSPEHEERVDELLREAREAGELTVEEEPEIKAMTVEQFNEEAENIDETYPNIFDDESEAFLNQKQQKKQTNNVASKKMTQEELDFQLQTMKGESRAFKWIGNVFSKVGKLIAPREFLAGKLMFKISLRFNKMMGEDAFPMMSEIIPPNPTIANKGKLPGILISANKRGELAEKNFNFQKAVEKFGKHFLLTVQDFDNRVARAVAANAVLEIHDVVKNGGGLFAGRIPSNVEKLFNRIAGKEGKKNGAYVHCKAGRARTGIIIGSLFAKIALDYLNTPDVVKQNYESTYSRYDEFLRFVEAKGLKGPISHQTALELGVEFEKMKRPQIDVSPSKMQIGFAILELMEGKSLAELSTPEGRKTFNDTYISADFQRQLDISQMPAYKALDQLSIQTGNVTKRKLITQLLADVRNCKTVEEAAALVRRNFVNSHAVDRFKNAKELKSLARDLSNEIQIYLDPANAPKPSLLKDSAAKSVMSAQPTTLEGTLHALNELGAIGKKENGGLDYEGFFSKREQSEKYISNAPRSQEVNAAETKLGDYTAVSRNVYVFHDENEYAQRGITLQQWQTNQHLQSVSGGREIVNLEGKTVQNIDNPSLNNPLGLDSCPDYNIVVQMNEFRSCKGYFGVESEIQDTQTAAVMLAYGHEFENYSTDELNNNRCPYLSTEPSYGGQPSTKVYIDNERGEFISLKIKQGTPKYKNLLPTEFFIREDAYKKFIKENFKRQIDANVFAYQQEGYNGGIQININLPSMGYYANLGGIPDDYNIGHLLAPIAAKAYREVLEELAQNQDTSKTHVAAIRLSYPSGDADKRNEKGVIYGAFNGIDDANGVQVGNINVRATTRFPEVLDKSPYRQVVCVSGDKRAYGGCEKTLFSQEPGIFRNFVFSRKLFNSLINVFRMLNPANIYNQADKAHPTNAAVLSEEQIRGHEKNIGAVQEISLAFRQLMKERKEQHLANIQSLDTGAEVKEVKQTYSSLREFALAQIEKHGPEALGVIQLLVNQQSRSISVGYNKELAKLNIVKEFEADFKALYESDSYNAYTNANGRLASKIAELKKESPDLAGKLEVYYDKQQPIIINNLLSHSDLGAALKGKQVEIQKNGNAAISFKTENERETWINSNWAAIRKYDPISSPITLQGGSFDVHITSGKLQAALATVQPKPAPLSATDTIQVKTETVSQIQPATIQPQPTTKAMDEESENSSTEFSEEPEEDEERNQAMQSGEDEGEWSEGVLEDEIETHADQIGADVDEREGEEENLKEEDFEEEEYEGTALDRLKSEIESSQGSVDRFKIIEKYFATTKDFVIGKFGKSVSKEDKETDANLLKKNREMAAECKNQYVVALQLAVREANNDPLKIKKILDDAKKAEVVNYWNSNNPRLPGQNTGTLNRILAIEHLHKDAIKAAEKAAKAPINVAEIEFKDLLFADKKDPKYAKAWKDFNKYCEKNNAKASIEFLEKCQEYSRRQSSGLLAEIYEKFIKDPAVLNLANLPADVQAELVEPLNYLEEAYNATIEAQQKGASPVMDSRFLTAFDGIESAVRTKVENSTFADFQGPLDVETMTFDTMFNYRHEPRYAKAWSDFVEFSKNEKSDASKENIQFLDSLSNLNVTDKVKFANEFVNIYKIFVLERESTSMFGGSSKGRLLNLGDKPDLDKIQSQLDRLQTVYEQIKRGDVGDLNRQQILDDLNAVAMPVLETARNDVYVRYKAFVQDQKAKTATPRLADSVKAFLSKLSRKAEKKEEAPVSMMATQDPIKNLESSLSSHEVYLRNQLPEIKQLNETTGVNQYEAAVERFKKMITEFSRKFSNMKFAAPDDPRIPVLEVRLATLQQNMKIQFGEEKAEEKAPEQTVRQSVESFLERTVRTAVKEEESESNELERVEIPKVESHNADQQTIDNLNKQLQSCKSLYNYVLDMKKDSEAHGVPTEYAAAAGRAATNVGNLSKELAKAKEQYPSDTRLKTIENEVTGLKNAMQKNLQEDKAKAHLTVENNAHGVVGLSVVNKQAKKLDKLEERTWIYDAANKTDPLIAAKPTEDVSKTPHIVQKGDSFTYFPASEEINGEDDAIRKVLQLAIKEIDPESKDDLKIDGDDGMKKKANAMVQELIDEHKENKRKLAAEASKPKQQAKDMDIEMENMNKSQTRKSVGKNTN